MKSSSIMLPLSALFLALLAGCTTRVRPSWLDESRQESLDRRYAPWGAYYILDETRFEATYTYPFVLFILFTKDHPTTTVTTHRKLHILSTAGMPHATMQLPRRWGSILKIDATITDPAGTVRRIPDSRVRPEYLRSGRIVFDGAVPGSILEVFVVHEAQGFAAILEEDFSRPVPVARGRLILDHLTWMKYSISTYGGLSQRDTTVRATNGFEVTRRMWEGKDILPAGQLPYAGWADETVPRAVGVLRSARFHFSEPSTCEELGKRYGSLLDDGLFSRNVKARAFARQLVRDSTTNRGRADAIHRFIVDSMKLADDGYASTSQSADLRFAARRGTAWQIAHLYRAMLKEIGIASRIVFLRDRSQGGFDTGLPHRYQLQTTMLVLDVDSTKLVALPGCRSCALGEYPASFFGLSALQLDKGTCAPLPRSTADSGRALEEQWIAMQADGTLESRIRWTFSAFAALDSRFDFGDLAPSERESEIERWLQARDPGNRVDSVRFTGLDRPGQPVVIEARLRNALASRPLGGGQHQVTLAPLVPQAFSQMDTLRTSPWVQSVPYRSELVLHLPAGARRRWLCPEISNGFYKQACSETQDGIRRIVEFPVARIAPDTLRMLHGDLARANLFRYSRLVLRP